MSFLSSVAPIIDHDLSVGRFREEDAASLSSLFRTIYGDAYPSTDVYDPSYLADANRKGTICSYICRDQTGEVAAHLALVQSAPFSGTMEVAQGLVHPTYRGAGLLSRLMELVIEEADRSHDCATLFATPVCNHVMSQRSLASAGFTDAAFEVDYTPARLFAKEGSSRGRVATLFSSRTLKPSPELVSYLPRAYASVIADIFREANAQRRFLRAQADLPLPKTSVADVTDVPTLDLAKITVTDAGRDFTGRVQTVEQQARRDGRVVVQVLVDMSTPTLDAAVEMLRSAGYWFGGVLPRYLNADALLMQKTLSTPNFDEVKAYSAAARDLLRIVQADWLRANVAVLVTAPGSNTNPMPRSHATANAYPNRHQR